MFRASLLSLDKGFNQILIPELVVGIGVWDLSRCSCGADGKPPPNHRARRPFCVKLHGDFFGDGAQERWQR